ncbi:MAG: hypothetical protein ACRDQ0_09720, partial [Pseudonocardia sp.]
KKAGDHTRQGFTAFTDQVSTALHTGHRLNGPTNTNTTTQPGTREHATTPHRTNTDGPPALAAVHHPTRPDCTSEPGCTEQTHAPTGHKPTTHPARGPPDRYTRYDDHGTHAQRAHHKTNGRATAAKTSPATSRNGRSGSDNDLREQISGLVDNFVSNVLKLVGGKDGSSGQAGEGSQQASTGLDGGGLGERVTELTGGFVQELLKRLGVSGSERSSGASQAPDQQPEQPITHRPRPANASSTGGSKNVDQMLGGVVDLVSGIVTTVAGKKAGTQTRQALTGLTDEVSAAIAAGNGLDSRGPGMGGTNTSTPAGSGHTGGGSPATPPEEATGPITCQALGVCPAQSQPTTQRAGTPQARGPPAPKPAAKKAALPKGISTTQAANAEKIVNVGRKMGIPKRGLQVALATALQESRLHNLPGGDRDSRGLFQQRPSQGWGTKAQVRDPTHAATEFFSHLKKVRGWQHKSINQAAQAVQHSGRPHAYAKWAHKASDLLDHVLGTSKNPKKTPTPQPTTSTTTSTGAGTGGGVSGRGDPANSVQELTGNFVTNVLGLVRQAGQQGGQSGTNTSGGAGSGGASTNSQGGLAGAVQELTGGFVSSLFDLLGINQPNGQQGSQRGGHPSGQSNGAGGATSGGAGVGGQGGRGDLAGAVQELTGNFVTSLLNLLGINPPAGQPGNGAGSAGGGGGKTGGQNNEWSPNTGGGQFAGTECQSEVECALAGGTLSTRQPSST